jgi:hypothetical protein
MAIKAAAARPWGERTHTSNTWYEPYVSEEVLHRNIRFVLSVPAVQAFCTPGDLELLPAVFRSANSASPMEEVERNEVMAATTGEPHIFPMPTLA